MGEEAQSAVEEWCWCMSLGFLVLRFGKFVGCGGYAKALAGVGGKVEGLRMVGLNEKRLEHENDGRAINSPQHWIALREAILSH